MAGWHLELNCGLSP